MGAALGTGLIAAGKALLLDRRLAPLFEGSIPTVSYADILLQARWLLLIGVVVSGLASVVSLRRHLRV